MAESRERFQPGCVAFAPVCHIDASIRAAQIAAKIISCCSCRRLVAGIVNFRTRFMRGHLKSVPKIRSKPDFRGLQSSVMIAFL